MKKYFYKFLIIFPSVLIIFSLVAGTTFYFGMWILPKLNIKESYVVKYVDSSNEILFQKHFDEEGSYISIEKMGKYIPAFMLQLKIKISINIPG